MRNHSVSDFLSKFERGFAKPNMYRVEMNLPRGVNGFQPGQIGINADSMAGTIMGLNNTMNRNDSINLKCHTMTMPQRSLMTYELKQNSAPYRLPYSASFDPVTFGFYTDSSYDTRDFFDVWQSTVINTRTNTLNFYDEYTADIHMYAMDAMGRDTYHVTLYEAYPINLGIIDLSYSQSNNYQSVMVTMAYKYWLPSNNREVRTTET